MPQNFNLTAQIAYLQWLSDDDAAGEQFVRTLRDYASGRQPVYLTDRQQEFIGLRAKDANYLFAYNLCQLVIEAVVERLTVTGFEAIEETREETPDEDARNATVEAAKRWAELNRMDAMQDEIYESAVRDGESFVVVDWTPEGYPRWSVNDTYNGTQGIKVYRDPNTGAALFAAKVWQVYDPINTANNGRTRVTYYHPNRVEKYISTRGANRGIGGSSWEQILDPEDTTWPLPWVDRAGAPLGCAAIAFENPGGSEIASLLPLQDALNKSALDLIAAADASGFRMLWAKGVQAEIDKATGAEKKLTIGPGKILRLSGDNASLNAIDPVDLSLLIASCKHWVEAAAGVTRTPQYLFQALGGDQPSGESLKNQEIGLIHKVERRQRVFGNAWEDVLYLSAQLNNLYGAQATPLVRLQTQWANPQIEEPSEAIEQRNAATAKGWVDAGIPVEVAVRRVGWSEDEVKALVRAKKAEAKAQQSTLGAALANSMRQLDQGQNVTPGIGGQNTDDVTDAGA
jgi:hypothetical protein